MKLNASAFIQKLLRALAAPLNFHLLTQPFLLILAFVLLCSHDLYLKMDSYFLQPHKEAIMSLYNGSFEVSENIITRDRIIDASILSKGKRSAITPNQWQDRDSTITQINFKTGEAGTYVAGVSTKARNIELSAQKFNSYLKNDGVLDLLDQRTKDGLLKQDAVENYQKHVKAIYQVGDVKTNDWSTRLGYPIEFVPQANPYDTYTGETLEVLLLLDGQPLANHLVFADYIPSSQAHSHDGEDQNHEHQHQGGEMHSHESLDSVDHSTHEHQSEESHGHTHGDGAQEHTHQAKKDNTHSHQHSEDGAVHEHAHTVTTEATEGHSHDQQGQEHTHEHSYDEQEHEHPHTTASDAHSHSSEEKHGHGHTSGQQLRTNDQGIASLHLPEDGVYFLRTIYMTRATDSDELTHRSKWATLTFEVTHKHGKDTHTHDHDEENGIPNWVFILGSLLVIGVLFFAFRKKS